MADSRLIFKNTLFLAVRMPLALTLGLYTSRVILEQLGVVDFGIYAVIAGFILLMSFFNSAISSSIQRFMNFEIARNGGKDMRHVFAAGCLCIVLVTVCFLVVAEAAGYWFIEYKMSVPPEKLADARIVFQLALVVAVIELFRCPYHVLILSYEKMNFYAWYSILDATLKLVMALCLCLFGKNKLVVYVCMLIVIALIINSAFVFYCRKHFKNVGFSLRAPIAKVKEILGFIGWNTMTSVSDLAYQQGSSIILNIFFGVSYNATLGLTNQVKQGVTNLTRNVQVASVPQIQQTFASAEYDDFKMLVARISRISFFLMLFMGLPIVVNAGVLLDFWLTVLPPDIITFIMLVIAFCMVDSLTGPLWTSMQASGKLKLYQPLISVIWLMYLPAAYIAFKCGMPARWIIILQVIFDCVILFVRIIFAKIYCGIGFGFYFKDVVLPIIKVALVAAVPTYALGLLLDGAPKFFITSTVSCLLVGTAIYFFGLVGNEREKVREFVVRKIRRN